MCLCICGPQIFGITPLDAAHLSDIFDGLSPQVIMFNLNKIWVFHPGGVGGGGGGGGGGIHPILLRPTHVYLFSFFSKPCDSFGLCPTNRAHQSTPYVVLIHNRVPVTLHRTPNIVLIPTMHSYLCHAMFSCTCNAIMPNVYI